MLVESESESFGIIIVRSGILVVVNDSDSTHLFISKIESGVNEFY